MSDSSQGQGWWQASDGKWYPPELHPSNTPKLPPPGSQPPSAAAQPSSSAAQPQYVPTGPVIIAKKPWWRRWWVIALGVLVLVVGIAAVAGSNEADDETSLPAASGDEREGSGEAEEDSVADAPESEGEPAGERDEPELPPVGSREQPFALGSAAQFTLDTFGDADGSVWTVTVDGPGSDITQAVLDENMFNEPPAEGRLFYGVPVTLTLQSAGKEPLSPLFNISLEFFGPSTLEIMSSGMTEGCGVTPNEMDSMKEVFVGGSISGTVCYSVTPPDVEAGILLTLDEIEGDRIFLATR